MKLKKVFLSELQPADYNPRTDLQPDDPEYQAIKRSIEEFGYVEPIIVNSDYTVIGGHQRAKVLKDLGKVSVDVIVIDLDKTREKALNVALNKITGSWDMEKLSRVMEDLKIEDFDLSLTGFGEMEICQLLQEDITDVNEEWRGMPEFNQRRETGMQTIVVHFQTEESVETFAGLVGQKITKNTRYIWYPYKEHDRTADLRYSDGS